jgi:hypothetical protein
MRRLALPIAAAIALSGLTVLAAPNDSAQALDLPQQPTEAQCFATNPFLRSAPLAQRAAYALEERKFNGDLTLSRGIANQTGSGLASIATPSVPPGGGGPPVAAQTSAQLTGTGQESIIRVAGPKGSVPTVTIDSYSSGEPTSATVVPTTVTGMGLTAADAVAVTADDFKTTPTDQWLSRNFKTEPDEVALAWRTPATGGLEKIYVGLFEPTSSGDGLTAYGTTFSFTGQFNPSGNPKQDVLAITSADMDLDGDPEIVLGYQWGGNDAVKVMVLNVDDPTSDNPTLSDVASESFPIVNPGVSEITVGAGLFGGGSTQIAVGWQETDALAYRAPARLWTLSLPHLSGQKPAQLTTPANGVPLPLIGVASRAFTTQTSDAWQTSTFAFAVGDVDQHRLDKGSSVLAAGKDEIVVAYTDDSSVRTLVLDPSTPGLATRVSTSDNAISAPSTAPRGVTLGVGDMDQDARDDIAVVYHNSAGNHRGLWYSLSTDGSQLPVRATMTPEMGSAAGDPLPVVIADVGDRSIRMTQRRSGGSGPACVDVKTPILLSAADPAPFWQTPGQLNWWGYTQIGSSKDVGYATDHTVTQTAGGSFTVSFGADSEIPIPTADTLEIEISREYETSWETSTANALGASDDFSLSRGMSNLSANNHAQYALVNYRCYYYDVTTPTGTPGQTRSCIPLDPDAAADPTFDPRTAFLGTASTAIQDTVGWETGADPAAPPQDFAWAPFRPEWTNLTLPLPPSAASQSGGNGTAGKAIDGIKDPKSATTVAETSAGPDPWWQVKLDASQDIGLVRVFPGALPSCQPDVCDDVLKDFDVYVFDGDNLAGNTAAELQSAGVVPIHFVGTPARVANIITRTGSTHDPVRGRYVRIQMTSPSADLQLAEVQVYPADDRQLPPAYPCSVSDASQADMFTVSVWDSSTGQCVDKLISGHLVPMSPTPDWMRVTAGACDAYQEGSWSSSNATSTTFTTSDSNTQSTGTSVDVALGPDVFAVQAGVGYAYNSGTENSYSRTTSVGKSLTVGWGRGNYCNRDYNGDYLPGYTTAAACAYEIKPFYYIDEEWSNAGYQQLFPHVSYQVRMDRSKDLTDCYDDHWRLGANVAPQAPDQAVALIGSSVDADPLALATDQNSEDAGRLFIRGVASTRTGIPSLTSSTANGGNATVVDGKVTYTPPAWGTWSTDTFYVTISDHDLDSQPIQITVVRPFVTNGDFNGLPALVGWTTTGGGVSVLEQQGSIAGKFARLKVLGSGGATTLEQSFMVPSAGTGTLALYRRGVGTEALVTGQSPGHDTLQVSVTAGGTTQVLDTVSDKDVTAAWRKYEYDLSAFKGQVVKLQLTGTGPDDGYATDFDVDEIAWTTPADHWVARVNAGGTTVAATDAGPGWAQDTASAPSSYHNANSNVVDYGNLSITRGANLPASTPTAIFSTERWSPNDSPNMQWDFLATVGHHLTVRLYFSNDYSFTSQPGQRKFNVAIDGTTVLSNYDIVADVGNQVGTMKTFDITSDGNVDIDFSHVLENPLINGIEIIDNEVPAP